jgi:hypothetical protein
MPAGMTGIVPDWFLTVVAMATVFTVMFSIGLGVGFGDFRWIWRRPALMLKALFAVLVAVPAVALVVAHALELPRLAEVVALALQEVGVEREDHVGAREVEERLHRRAERDGAAGPHRLLARGLPGVEPGAGEAGLHPAPERLQRRRARGLDEEAQPRPTVPLVLLREPREPRHERGARERPALPREPAEPGRIVEIEDRRLEDRVRAAAVRGVGGVALDLRRATLPARHDEPDRVAAPARRRRVRGRDARRHRLRPADVRDHLLARRLAALEPGERYRGAEDLEEAAAGEPLGRLRGALRELARLGDGAAVLGEGAPAPREQLVARGRLSVDGEL